MIAFEVCDLVVAASRTLDLGTGATLDLLDLAAAEAALAEAGAEALAAGDHPAAGDYPPAGDRAAGDPAAEDPAAAAAALLCALVLRRPFRRGNDRIALVAALQLLALHGCRANLDPPEATMSIIAGITAGQAGTAEVRNWLLPRLYRESEAEKWEAQMQNLLPARRRRRRADKSSGGLFMRFNDEARQAIVLAHEEARTLNHGYIGTEHILLGLLHEGDGIAARALQGLGITLAAVRQRVQEIIGHGKERPSGHIPFTPRAKKVIQLSRQEAADLGSDHIATEHILLALTREGGGVAAQVLTRLGAGHGRLREEAGRLAAAAKRDGTQPGGDQQSA
jgi:Clp amino terminal domain, pathogenicity island component